MSHTEPPGSGNAFGIMWSNVSSVLCPGLSMLRTTPITHTEPPGSGNAFGRKWSDVLAYLPAVVSDPFYGVILEGVFSSQRYLSL